jgi:sugar lactone lactonase YvrE
VGGMTQATQLTDAVCFHGEGPVWFGGEVGLRFVDMLAGDVLTLDPAGRLLREHVGEIAAVVRPRAGGVTPGAAIVAVERGFALAEGDPADLAALGELTRLPEVFADPKIRMNEGNADPDGRFRCGSMAYDQAPDRGAMYLLDPDGSRGPGGAVAAGFGPVTISNGLGFTGDGAHAYYIDTPTLRVDLFDYDRQSGLTNRRPFITFEKSGGVPDGLCVDAEDGIWVALNGGGAAVHVSASGTRDATVTLDAVGITAVTLGGEDLRTLYLTTSRENLGDRAEAGAGAVFTAHADVAGVPPLPYAG